MEGLPDRAGTCEAALDYWRMGLPVIPLRGKRPAVRDWQRFERSAVSIRFWFGTRRCNVGLVTGEYVVIDSDSEAAEWWVKERRIETPMMVRSGGGGLHRYFDGRGLGIRNWQGLFGIRGLDGRGQGGFIVLPPSVHPETGKRYEFLTQMLPPEALPKFDRNWVTPIRAEPQRVRKVGRPASPAWPDLDAVRRSIRRTFAVSGSGGHNATFAVSCALAEAGLGYDEVLAELRAWNETNVLPAWSLKELEHKARDAVRKVFGNSARVPP